jgi:hypothetical protein
MTQQHDAPEGGAKPDSYAGFAALIDAPTLPAPSGLVDQTLVAQMENKFGPGSVAAWDGSDEKAIVGLNATLSGQQGGAVPAGDLRPGLEAAKKLVRETFTRAPEVVSELVARLDRLAEQPVPAGTGAFAFGDPVEKTKGSSWRGRVVGTYSTSLTPRGYAVESEREPGSVQIYPEEALRLAPAGTGDADPATLYARRVTIPDTKAG